jgi:predicted permease
MKREHPEDYVAKADFEIHADMFRDELTHDARTILLVLMATCVLVFVIACSNVANLILARSVRREAELGIRAALGASRAALRRTLLSESLLLCIAGAGVGVLIANPMLAVLARYISRFSVRALDLKVDPTVLWVSAALALIAAPLLAFVPRLPQSGGQQGFSLASGSARVTSGANRKLRLFAVIQIATCFVLVASATASVKTLISLQAARRGFETHHVLSVEVPVMHWGRTPAQLAEFYREAARRIRELPGVQNVSTSMNTPWRDTNDLGLQFSTDGHVPASNEEHLDARFRVVSPAFFATLGLPILEGRDFTDADRMGKESVAIVSQSFVQRVFGNRDPLNHTVMWTDPILKAIPGMINEAPARIVGVVPDIDDTNLVPRPSMTIYRAAAQEQVLIGDHFFVHVSSDPYALVTPITRLIHKLSSDQPVEHAATLEDVRADVLSNDRVNAIVFGAFAGVALLIAIVGVGGVLAFSVSGRTREFGIRLAVGSQPRSLLTRVMIEGAAIGCVGLAVGIACGFVLTRVAGGLLADLKTPSVLPVAASALILLLAAVTASLIPAARAARIDVVRALRVD